jgi:adenosylcobinamide-GDP ribazoletransferase
LVYPKAKKDGMLRQDTDPAAKSSAAAMAAVSLLLASAMIYTGALPGAAAVLTAVLTLALYYRMAVTVFGGITGDLSGWFTQTCELVAAMAALFVCRCA